MQRTLIKTVSLKGIGLHTGVEVTATLKPAETYTGIVFHRTDVTPGSGAIEVCASAVKDTKLCTQLANDYDVTVSTIEHLMAALCALGVDNVIVELDAEEIPVMDGSSQPWVDLIDEAGLIDQDEPRKMIKVLREVVVREGNSICSVRPCGEMKFTTFIHFGTAIPPQKDVFIITEEEFREELAVARTFCFASDVEQMKSMGLVKGGSLQNAVVLNEDGQPLNEEGLRFDNEMLRHKTLDSVGDFFVAGYRIQGAFNLTRPGHEMNNLLLKELLSDTKNWKWI
jgi:UDP-3-O-[3-hydroxymyristoyl] N-acetylglucosamine deacetylase